MSPLRLPRLVSTTYPNRRRRQRAGLTLAFVAVCAAGLLQAGSAAAVGAPNKAASKAAAAPVTTYPIGVDSDGSSTTMKGSALYASNPGLSPQTVTGGSFGQLFATHLNGDIQTQPLVADGTLLVGTEANYAYGLDPVTGAIRWSDYFGVPWNPAQFGCDAAPTEGITGTPVVVNNVEYFTTKTYASGSSGPASYFFQALNVTTGAEQPDSTAVSSVTASNDPSLVFTATNELQRPGLVYTGGVVYAAFGSSCDHTPGPGLDRRRQPDGAHGDSPDGHDHGDVERRGRAIRLHLSRRHLGTRGAAL